MAFTALSLSHAPDADYKKHNCVIDTGKYRLLVYVVKSQDEALKLARSIYETERMDAVLLCPGFTHSDVAEIFKMLEGKVSVSVARGDGPSSQIANQALQKADFI
ncbi:MAG: DUF6506 family protein [Acidobacteriota bacterium]